MAETSELPEDIKKLADACVPKHVQVVQAILSGEYGSNTAAYQAFYPDADADSANANCARMLAIDSVRKLYNALRDERLMQGVLSRAEAMQILTNMARHSLSDLVTFGSMELPDEKTGETRSVGTWAFKDSSELTPEALATISELSSTKEGNRIKTHDQKAAIKLLSDMAGWAEPKKIEVDVTENSYLAKLASVVNNESSSD